jgi:quercetin dioxygenase-like cupin family protein
MPKEKRMRELREILRDRRGVCPFLATMLCISLFGACSTHQGSRASSASPGTTSQKVEPANTGVKCTEDSPERRGQEGCTVLANRPLAGSVDEPLYWHLDRFDSLEAAKKAAGPNGVAAEAHGGVWLMTVEAQAEEHHGAGHLAWIGPLPLPNANRYGMRVQSSLLRPGSTTPVHTHPGPEVVYVVDGQQCTETPEGGRLLGAGQYYIVPSGLLHRGRVMGSRVRRLLAVNLYDAAHPVSHDPPQPPPLVSCD